VAAHAKYLSQNRSRRVRVEGNTDERGSREYNLALGQRRADAVKQMMQLLGASGDQIETLSFGEEKPKASGHDESAWQENRRADIRYQGE
jgi:peptidoglycan-associated lipoprotein